MNLAPDTSSEDLKVFLQEADEQLQLLDEDIIRLERDGGNPELLNEIFRTAHTIKGSSGMLGYRPMADLSHKMESLLDKLRKGTLTVSPQMVNALLDGLDVLKLLKSRLVSPAEGEVDISAAMAALDRVEQGPGSANVQHSTLSGTGLSLSPEAIESIKALLTAGNSIYRITVTLRRETPWAAVRCFQILNELSELGEVLGSRPSREEIESEKVGSTFEIVLTTSQDKDKLKSMVASVEDVENVEFSPFSVGEMPAPAQGPGTEQAATPKAGQQHQTVRIDVDRLDHLMNTIGELVIDRTRIIQICKSLESRYKEDEVVQALSKTSSHIVKVVDSLQENTMKVRMLPIGTVFSGLPRMVRDLAQKAGKQVDFIVQGQETEIDRTIIERIRDPLVHLLRNAIDHGLETPEGRRAAAKPETGVIRLAAYHEQGHIVITIEDDGRGIDVQRVKDAAVRKGLISADSASRLSDAEGMDLIFKPGLSTSEKTTEISGRGVGLDIVRTNIQAINGFVTLDTRIGQGARFTLKLPLTLAILSSLLVSLDRTVYAVPLVHVLEAVKLKPEEINTVRGKEVIQLRRNILPLLRLSTILGTEEERSDHSGETIAVVVRFGERLVALAADALMESQEIVVKSLGKYIGEIKGIAGASILGDGQVVLILDVPSLIDIVVDKCNGLAPGTRKGDEIDCQ